MPQTFLVLKRTKAALERRPATDEGHADFMFRWNGSSDSKCSVIGDFGIIEPHQPAVARRQHSEDAYNNYGVLLHLGQEHAFLENDACGLRLTSVEQLLSECLKLLGSYRVLRTDLPFRYDVMPGQ